MARRRSDRNGSTRAKMESTWSRTRRAPDTPMPIGWRRTASHPAVPLGFSWRPTVSLQKPLFLGVGFLGFPWILSSESSLFNGLYVVFAGKFFLGVFPIEEAAGRKHTVKAMRKRRIVHGASLTHFLIFCNTLRSKPSPSAASIQSSPPYLAEPRRTEPARADELQEHRVIAFGDALRHAVCDNGIEKYEPRGIGQQSDQQGQRLDGRRAGRRVRVSGDEIGRFFETRHHITSS